MAAIIMDGLSPEEAKEIFAWLEAVNTVNPKVRSHLDVQYSVIGTNDDIVMNMVEEKIG